MQTIKTSYFPAHYRWGDKLGWLALRAYCGAVLLFLLLPIFVIVPLSFSSGSFLAYPLPGWSLQWYQELIHSPDWARAARNSFIVAPLATLLATTLGTLAAVGLARTNFIGKGMLTGLLISPMVVPNRVPRTAIQSASVLIIRRICLRVIPTALSNPISLNRSYTLSESVFTIPRKATRMLKPKSA